MIVSIAISPTNCFIFLMLYRNKIKEIFKNKRENKMGSFEEKES